MGGVALVEEGASWELVVPLGPGRGEILPELIKEVLARRGMGWEGITLLAVDVGPGSFTGLRLGMSLAKALAQVHGLPLVPVRQTEAVGLPLAEVWPGRVCVWIQDRREHVYVAWVEGERAGPETVLPFSEALARVADRSDVLLTGPGALRFQEEIRAQAPQILIAPALWAHPRPAAVAYIGQVRYTREGATNLFSLEPHYVHKEVAHG